MTPEQEAYVVKAARDNPGWTVVPHESAAGTIIAEVGEHVPPIGRWRAAGLVRLSPEGRVIEWSQR